MKTELGNKEILAKNLKRLMKVYGIDRNKLAEAIGVKYSSISDWCNGYYYPRMDSIEAMAIFFNVDKDELVEDHPEALDERLASIKKKLSRVPVLGSIPAGVPLEAIESDYIVDYEEVPSEWLKGGKQYFALRISGDSMMPDFNDGDIVVFLKTSEFVSGQNCCVRINNTDATFKKVTIEPNGIMLSPLNIHNSSGFLPRVYTEEEVASLPVEILGVPKKVVKYL